MQNWKLIVVAGVLLVFGAVGVYPQLATRYGLPAPKWLLDRQLKLGLDLQGGVHLVLRVQTDTALRVETDLESERLREALSKEGVNVTVNTVSPTEFRVEGVPADRDAQFRQLAADNVETNFDRSSGAGGSYTFTMKPSVQVTLREEAVD